MQEREEISLSKSSSFEPVKLQGKARFKEKGRQKPRIDEIDDLQLPQPRRIPQSHDDYENKFLNENKFKINICHTMRIFLRHRTCVSLPVAEFLIEKPIFPLHGIQTKNHLVVSS